jgi:hypothetical protein
MRGLLIPKAILDTLEELDPEPRGHYKKRTYHRTQKRIPIETPPLAKKPLAKKPIPTPVVIPAKKTIEHSIDWLELHRPKNVASVFGREQQIQRFQAWLADFKDNPTPAKPLALLHGRPGTGKTTVSHVLAKIHGYELVEVNASDTRSYEEISKILDRVCLRQSITGKAALLLDEIDGAFESESGRSSITAIKDFLAAHQADRFKAPIIATCNVTHKADIKTLFPLAEVISFPKIFDNHLTDLATSIAHQHEIRITTKQLHDVVQQANGDARQVIQSLRLLSLQNGEIAGKDNPDTIFEVAKRLLSGVLPDVNPDLFTDCGGYGLGLLFENYVAVPTLQPNNKQVNREVSLLADTLSDCDLLRNIEEIDVELATRGAVVFSKSVPRAKPVSLNKCAANYFSRSSKQKDLWESYITDCV